MPCSLVQCSKWFLAGWGVSRATGRDTVVWGWCLFAWNFSVTRSTVRREKKEDYTKHDAVCCPNYSLLDYRLKIPPTKIHALHYSSTMTLWRILQPLTSFRLRKHWGKRQQDCLKQWYTSTVLHCGTTQKTTTFIFKELQINLIS